MRRDVARLIREYPSKTFVATRTPFGLLQRAKRSALQRTSQMCPLVSPTSNRAQTGEFDDTFGHPIQMPVIRLVRLGSAAWLAAADLSKNYDKDG